MARENHHKYRRVKPRIHLFHAIKVRGITCCWTGKGLIICLCLTFVLKYSLIRLLVILYNKHVIGCEHLHNCHFYLFLFHVNWYS